MINIIIPKNNISALKYTVNVLFGCFLGLDYALKIDNNISDVILSCNENWISFESRFFNDDIKYIPEKIPSKVKRLNISVDNESKNLISLFKGNISLNGKIQYELDILASTFFMLTRWEELANPIKDIHGRFPASESLAYKEDFLERPIVNEYVELLWVLLKKIGCKQKRKKRTFKLVPTHDVDKPFLFNGFFSSLRYFVGSLKRGRFSELKRYVSQRITNSDPYDSFDKLMDLSEESGAKSMFFFLQKGKNRADENHEIDTPEIRNLIKTIQKRGHEIGFHPSYEANINSQLFTKEKKNLERIVDDEVEIGRHHFLRWDILKTPQIWEQNNMKWDSTLGYADHAGFRCGVCYPFPLYDLENNKQLEVYERPLIAMEWSLIHYQKLSIEETEEYIWKLKLEVKKYNGEFVFLYHNSAFFTDEYIGKSQRLLQALYK